MKICAIICEYNPFHNGHLYQIRETKKRSGTDGILCLMSGNFVQRGEGAIMDKFTRAKHAVEAGADCVIELPAVFATSNAELFAKGAVHILSSIPAVTTLCFGAENADKTALIDAAKQLNEEPTEVSKRIKELTSLGVSYAKARATAWEGRVDEKLLSSPNCILGVEYIRAILSKGCSIDPLPIARVGGDYKNEALDDEYSSATAIRTAITERTDYSSSLPAFVAKDLPQTLENGLELLEKAAILDHSAQEIAEICDCTEGLENAFKKAAELPSPLVETLTSARYTSSRIRRIALHCLLNIKEALIRKAVSSPLYLRVLAIKKQNKAFLSALSESAFPLLIRAHDERALSDVARKCYERDIFAEKIYGLLYPQFTINKELFH